MTDKSAKKSAAKPARKLTKKPAKPQSSARELPLLATRSPAPADLQEVRDELTIFWDAFSPLSLAAVRMACDAGKSLDDIGITEDQAGTFVNKYNSIVLRAPGKGPLVTASEATKWHGTPMQKIIADVTARSQP